MKNRYAVALSVLVTSLSLTSHASFFGTVFGKAEKGIEMTNLTIDTGNKGITLQSLADAYDLCLSGDLEKRPEIVSLNQRMAQAIGLLPVTQDEGNMSSMVSSSDEEIKVSAASGQIRLNRTTSYSAPEKNESGYLRMNMAEINWALSGKKFLSCAAKDDNCTIEDISYLNMVRRKGSAEILADRILLEIEGEDDSVRAVKLISDKKLSLPTYSYTSVDAGSDYDSLGQYVPAQTVVRGLSLQVPKDMAAPINFINAKTSKATKVTVDFKEFISCMRTEAAKGLK